ncbi:Aurofusarin cluster transcription factor aurR2 [Apiospora arundinis]
MQLTTIALTSASIATTVLAAGAPPITTTTSASASSSTVLTFVISDHPSTTRLTGGITLPPPTTRSHDGTTLIPHKPQGTGVSGPAGGNSTGPHHGYHPQVTVIVESPAVGDACGNTNTTIRVPLEGVYTNNKVLAKVSALYLTGVSGGHASLNLATITCTPYLKTNGTGPTAGNAFKFGSPARNLSAQVGTPNHIGSIFCGAPGGSMPGGGAAPGGGAPGGNGNGGNGKGPGAPAPAPTPNNPTTPPPGSPAPPAKSSVVPASGAADFGVPTVMSAALVGVLGVMFTL